MTGFPKQRSRLSVAGARTSQTYKVKVSIGSAGGSLGRLWSLWAIGKGWVRGDTGKWDVDFRVELFVVPFQLWGQGAVLPGSDNLGVALADGGLAQGLHDIAIVKFGTAFAVKIGGRLLGRQLNKVIDFPLALEANSFLLKPRLVKRGDRGILCVLRGKGLARLRPRRVFRLAGRLWRTAGFLLDAAGLAARAVTGGAAGAANAAPGGSRNRGRSGSSSGGDGGRPVLHAGRPGLHLGGWIQRSKEVLME